MLMKYVVFTDHALTMMAENRWPKGGQIVGSIPGREYPIIFPDELVHAVVVEKLREVYPGITVVGAGFAILTEDGFGCFGKSTSLGVKSREYRDSMVLDELESSLEEFYEQKRQRERLQQED